MAISVYLGVIITFRTSQNRILFWQSRGKLWYPNKMSQIWIFFYACVFPADV